MLFLSSIDNLVAFQVQSETISQREIEKKLHVYWDDTLRAGISGAIPLS